MEDSDPYGMRLSGRTAPATCGEIYPLCNNSIEGDGDNKSSNGFVIPEAQSRILDVLVKCSKTILHDIGKTNIISNSHPIEPALPAFLARMASKLSSLRQGPRKVHTTFHMP